MVASNNDDSESGYLCFSRCKLQIVACQFQPLILSDQFTGRVQYLFIYLAYIACGKRSTWSVDLESWSANSEIDSSAYFSS